MSKHEIKFKIMVLKCWKTEIKFKIMILKGQKMRCNSKLWILGVTIWDKIQKTWLFHIKSWLLIVRIWDKTRHMIFEGKKKPGTDDKWFGDWKRLNYTS